MPPAEEGLAGQRIKPINSVEIARTCAGSGKIYSLGIFKVSPVRPRMSRPEKDAEPS